MAPSALPTDRLVLRSFRDDDVDDVLAYANDETFARFVPNMPWPYTRAHAEEFVEMAVATDEEAGVIVAIEREGAVIGACVLEVDRENWTAELGYGLGARWRGYGYATEAARGVLDVGFGDYGVAVIWARTDADNRPSRRVLERLGMRLDGILRGRRLHRGQRADECHYSMIIEEWLLTVPVRSHRSSAAPMPRAERAAASRATPTRNGEQDT